AGGGHDPGRDRTQAGGASAGGVAGVGVARSQEPVDGDPRARAVVATEGAAGGGESGRDGRRGGEDRRGGEPDGGGTGGGARRGAVADGRGIGSAARTDRSAGVGDGARGGAPANDATARDRGGRGRAADRG